MSICQNMFSTWDPRSGKDPPAGTDQNDPAFLAHLQKCDAAPVDWERYERCQIWGLHRPNIKQSGMIDFVPGEPRRTWCGHNGCGLIYECDERGRPFIWSQK